MSEENDGFGTGQMKIAAGSVGMESGCVRKHRLPFRAFAIFSALFLACATTPVHADKHRYTLSFGKGWVVCETYLKYLNATPASEEVPICDLKLKLVPGIREPDWEELDIAKHLKTVHQIELLLGVGHIEPAPEQDFERWKIQRKTRAKTNNERPRLRRTLLELVPDGDTETILSYDFDVQSCENEVHKARQKLPFRTGLGEPNFFIYDEAKQKVVGSSYWTTMARGILAIFQDRLYFLDPFLGWQTGTIGRTWFVRISRLDVVPPNPVGMRMHDLPNDPLYDSHELCLVRANKRFP